MGSFDDIELDDLVLTGDRLALRRWHADDAQRVFDIVNSGSMREFLNLPDPYTHQDALDYVTDFGHEGRGDGTGIGSAMVEKGSRRVVGACALRLGGDDPELGYWVAPDARGHGYAAEASRVLAAFAFAHGRPRVRLACDARNLASARTALAAGFRFEGVARMGVTSPEQSPDRPARRGDLARFARLADDPDEAVALAFPPLPPGGLTDTTISLRTVRPDDARALLESDDAESARWSFTGERFSAAEWATLATRAGLDLLVGTAARLAIVDAASGRCAGQVSLRRNGPPRVGGVGYLVHPDFRGRGYTARALRLLVRWAFEQAEFGRLELGAKQGNIASQRAAASAGFVPDGVREGRLLNADGTFGDEIRYCLLNPQAQRSS